MVYVRQSQQLAASSWQLAKGKFKIHVLMGSINMKKSNTSDGTKPLIAITMGDPAGVGPEVIVKALAGPEIQQLCRPLVLGDPAAMERAVSVTGSGLEINQVAGEPPYSGFSADRINLLPVSGLSLSDMEFGRSSKAAGDAVYRYISAAVRLCLEGEASAMATAPISKEALNRAGHKFPGHTELLAELTDTKNFVMMLAGDRLRVALVTIHEALADVPVLLTRERVLTTIRIVHREVGRYFRNNPRLAVLSLNPHCGEGGLFGKEENNIIQPAVEAARVEGIDAVGPLSADTLFHFAAAGEYDAVVCMYHDQGLIPLKLLHFDDGINITLGLPIIRTSVDHGTAYNLAGTGKASELSMAAAIKTAARMAKIKAQGASTNI
jgi:4-hydroxythreonine-4-phosphate dehydrogenase